MQTRNFHEISRDFKVRKITIMHPTWSKLCLWYLASWQPVVIPVVCLFDPGPSREDEGRRTIHSCEWFAQERFTVISFSNFLQKGWTGSSSRCFNTVLDEWSLLQPFNYMSTISLVNSFLPHLPIFPQSWHHTFVRMKSDPWPCLRYFAECNREPCWVTIL